MRTKTIGSWFRYLAGKRSEIESLDIKDAVMAKAILDIHRKRTHKRLIDVPLKSLSPIHILDRPNAISATEKRVAALERNFDELCREPRFSMAVLNRYIPSVSAIKVVQSSPRVYLAFEGNGRIAALKAVFGESGEHLIEVEQYCFDNPRKILRRLDRVRRLNGLLPETR